MEPGISPAIESIGANVAQALTDNFPTTERAERLKMADRRVAIVQSSYIPWKGYFDLIASVDEFVLYDSAQFTKRDWRNRNRIKTPEGTRWLTIPVQQKGKRFQRIDETLVAESSWATSHWKTLLHSYRKAPYFDLYHDGLADAYRRVSDELYLSRVNYILLTTVCAELDVQTPITWSNDYVLTGGPTERLLQLCQSLGATDYLSGPAARDYLDESQFRRAGITVSYADYSDYPQYQQLYGPFEHNVTILDLLLNTGPEATKFMKRF
jgi:hypothetical protein